MTKKIKDTIQEIPDLFNYIFGNTPRTTAPKPGDISLGKKTADEKEKEGDDSGDNGAGDENPPTTLSNR